ncbi:(2Fe-2S)-binding protein [Siccirubricoccus soli]
MKRPVSLTVNGRAEAVPAEPRTHLADLLREGLHLTGTHIGCEHGVCGACTVEVDGAPARSCLLHAGAAEGVAVRTIEGFDGDAVMAALRETFSAKHALQCGYYTPGMLVTARDIIFRLLNADETRVRGIGRQSLPLHWLSRHRPRHPPRAGAAARLRPCRFCSGWLRRALCVAARSGRTVSPASHCRWDRWKE